MTAPNDDLERRLREHYRSQSTPLPDDLVDGAWMRIGRTTPRRTPFVLLAASLGAIALAVFAVAIGGPLTDDRAPTAPSVAPTSVVTQTSAPPSDPAAKYQAGQILRVTGDGLGDGIEAYRGDYLYVVSVEADDGQPTAYQLQGPARSAAEDASAVTVEVKVVDPNTEPTLMDCPDPPSTLSELDAVEPIQRLCFEMLPLTLPDVWVEAPIEGHAALGLTPDGHLSGRLERGSGWLPFSVADGVTLAGPGWVTVVGRFGLHDETCGDELGKLRCRERFVIGSVQPGASPFSTLAGTWTRMADPPISGRSSYVALPIDRGTFIWGGDASEGATSGAIYDAGADRWTAIARTPGPHRPFPAAVWTGQQVLIWGGDGDLADGLAYDPDQDRWSPIPDAPIDGGYGSGAWTGTEFVVVSSNAQAAAWDPVTSMWRRLPDPPVPPGHMESAWTGREFIVLGIGEGTREPVVGAVFDPRSSTWRSIADVPYDSLILGIPAVWTDTELVFVSHAYDPVTDRWRILKREGCTIGAVSDGVWTGRWLMTQTQAYDLAAGRCQTLPKAPTRPAPAIFGELLAHEFHTPFWSDGRLVIWSGGSGSDVIFNGPDGVVFAPSEP